MTEGPVFPDLRGKVVFLSGGATGIGEALVRGFAGQGCRVWFTDILADAGALLAAELGADVAFSRTDMTDVAAIRSSVGACTARFGAPDVLVNNAASDDRHDFLTVTPDYYDRCNALNLRAHFFAAQAVAPGMIARGSGSIINMGSISWMIGARGFPAYATAKSAMQGLTKTLARELGPSGIRVNALLPGWILTKRQIDLWLDEAGEREIDARQATKARLYPADMAPFALFLASSASAACTGQSIVADGGWT